MISVKPVECNLNCLYCYEKQIRDKGEYPSFNFDATMKAVEKIIEKHKKITIHGGEPLYMGYEKFQKIVKYLASKDKEITIQTNGTLINDKFIKLFKKHNIHVGFSVDGLSVDSNYYRLYETKNKQEVLDKILGNLRKCEKRGIRTSIISVLHDKNIKTIIDDTVEFFEKYKIKAIRVNPMAGGKLKAGSVYHKLSDLVIKKGYDIRPILDIVKSLMVRNYSGCSFGECDVSHTTAEVTIMGNGGISNCLHNSQNGLTVRAENKSNIRYQMLPLVDQKHGGCKGCKYWRVCNGGCPANGINNDWRNKDERCEVYQTLFDL